MWSGTEIRRGPRVARVFKLSVMGLYDEISDISVEELLSACANIEISVFNNRSL